MVNGLYVVLIMASLLSIQILAQHIAVAQSSGATIELDKKIYAWTDKVTITIDSPDHNFDNEKRDEIGDESSKVTIASRGHKLSFYKLVETGVDTGIFTGEVILTGFLHDSDGNPNTGTYGYDTNPRTEPLNGGGPSNGFLEAENDDGITVSFEFAEDEVVVGSALIKWNEGEVQFLKLNYLLEEQGIVRVIDPDMNLNPELIDSFKMRVFSVTDSGGLLFTVTETGEATGIFEGTLYFTTTDESSGDKLRVSEGDTVTAKYDDNTPPDYPAQKELEIVATTSFGSISSGGFTFSNLRLVDSFGNLIQDVQVGDQVIFSADVQNNNDFVHGFTYYVTVKEIRNDESWINFTLYPKQQVNAAQSRNFDLPGTYNVQTHVYDDLVNRNDLAPPISLVVVVTGTKPVFDFGITANDVQLNAGKSATSTVTITKQSTITQTISLSCDINIPSNQGNCDVKPSVVNPGDSATITIYTKGVQPDTYIGTITGISSNIRHSDDFTVKVLPASENKLPTAVVSILSLEKDGSVTFSAENSKDVDGKIVKYEWYFGDGKSSNSITPTHVYENSNTYSVILKVIDEQGATGTARADVIVERINGGDTEIPLEVIVPVVAIGGGLGGYAALKSVIHKPPKPDTNQQSSNQHDAKKTPPAAWIEMEGGIE